MQALRREQASFGSAIRVPAAHDRRSRERLAMWLGDCGQLMADASVVKVLTDGGWTAAHVGEWVILTADGRYHVASRAGD
jgi:hypothetical protein